jgi:DNA-binding IclR family transcriptional regulator
MTVRIATNSLERGLALMKAIGQQRGGMTNAELSRHFDIPKSTCTYILTRLEREKYVIRDKLTGRYTIGLNTLSLAHDALREIRFPAIAEPTLYRLAERTGLVAILGVREGDRVLTVDRVESPDFMRDSAESGRSRWPFYPAREHRGLGAEYSLHASALGRVVLAHLPPQNLSEILEAIQLTKLTPKTIVSKTELLVELARIRKAGYSIADQQSHLDTLAIAAPIVEANGEVRASVCIAGSRLSPAFRGLSSLIVSVQQAGDEISKRLSQISIPEGQTAAVRITLAPTRAGRDTVTAGSLSLFQGRQAASLTH